MYCLSIFQRTCFWSSFFKSGCKGKDFIFNCQIFSEVFFYFQAFCRRPLSCERKSGYRKAGAFPCGSDCKDKNFIQLLPNFYGSFFRQHRRFVHHVNHCASTLSESGCKSSAFTQTSQIWRLIFDDFFTITPLIHWFSTNTKSILRQHLKQEISKYTIYYHARVRMKKQSKAVFQGFGATLVSRQAGMKSADNNLFCMKCCKIQSFWKLYIYQYEHT